jgi:hypothetical protein
MKHCTALAFAALLSVAADAQEFPFYRLDVAGALKTPDKCKLSLVAREIRYVPLEAKPGSFLKTVDYYAISDDFVVVADNDLGKILKFSRSGKFLGTIMSKGLGPLEFTSVHGLDLNSRGDLLIFKNWRVIDIYNSKDDKIRTINFEGYNTGKWLTDDRILLIMDYSERPGPVVVVLDISGRQISSSLDVKMDLGNRGAPGQSSLTKCKEGYYYWDQLLDTVYTISHEGKVKPRAVFTHARNVLTTEEFLFGPGDEMMQSGESYNVKYYREYKDKIFLQATVNSFFSIMVFDKATGKGKMRYKTHFFGLLNDIDKGPAFYPGRVLPDGSAVRMLIPQNDLYHYLDYTFRQVRVVNSDEYDIQVYQKLADYGNPALMFVK